MRLRSPIRCGDNVLRPHQRPRWEYGCGPLPPPYLLYRNPHIGTDSVFLVCLFALCVSQVVMLDCNIEALDGVYCFKFLSVMTTFLFGNRALKVKRPSLPRTHRISWTKSVLGFCAMALTLLGGVKLDLLQFFMIFVFELFKRAAIIRQLFPSSGLMSG